MDRQCNLFKHSLYDLNCVHCIKTLKIQLESQKIVTQKIKSGELLPTHLTDRLWFEAAQRAFYVDNLKFKFRITKKEFRIDEIVAS